MGSTCVRMRNRFLKAVAGAGRMAREPGGFALPTALMMTLAAIGTVSVGVVTTIQVQHGTIRDQGTKAGLQEAQTGVNTALLQFNRIAPSQTNPCSPVTTAAPLANGWCPPSVRSMIARRA